MLRKKIKNIKPIIKEKAANFIEIPDQYLDASKLQVLGFKPKTSFDEGINKTIFWYKKNFSHLIGLAQRYISK